MKSGIFWAAILAATAALPSCKKIVGEGPVVVENRSTPIFQGLSVQVESDSYFTQAGDFKVEIHAQQNVLNEIETVVINSKLLIRFRHHNTHLKTSERIKIYVTAPDVNLLEINGSGNMLVSAPLTPATIQFAVNGSGHINADGVETSHLEASISGSGNISIKSGTSNLCKAGISGSGYIDISPVIAKDADTHISGSGTIKVQATETLKAHISGSGHVFYKGTPAISSSVSGSGSVVKF